MRLGGSGSTPQTAPHSRQATIAAFATSRTSPPTTTTGSSSSAGGRGTLQLHTARKRSNANLIAAGADAATPATSTEASHAPRASGGGALPLAASSASAGASRAPASAAAAAMSLDARRASAGGGSGGGRTAAWRVGGYSMDYVLDWTIVAVAVVVLAALEGAVPRSAYIVKASLEETSYPLLPNSVPAWSVPLYSLVLPAALFVLHSVVLRRPLLEGHHLVLGLANAVLLTAVITNGIKCPVGRLRPDFNERCWPDGKVAWSKEDAWGGYPLCSGVPSVVAEGRKSFPSGHSSWSAAGLCYISWWLLDRLSPFGSASGGHSWRLVAALAPSLAAVAVGISRYTDYWHHASDVAAGLLLGALLSALCYRQQRARLAEVDVATYGDGSRGGLSGSSSSSRPAIVGDAVTDGTPLLYGAGGAQQARPSELPV